MNQQKSACGALLLSALVLGTELYEHVPQREMPQSAPVQGTRKTTEKRTRQLLGTDPDTPCNEELEAYYSSLPESGADTEVTAQRREDLRACKQGLEKEDRGFVQSVELERRAEWEFQGNCQDEEEACAETESEFLISLEEEGVDGWTWNPDFQFKYDQNGWTTEIVAFPGFELQLPGQKEGHDDFIHLEPVWDGNRAVVTLSLVHLENGESTADSWADDYSSADIAENLAMVRRLWEQGNAQ